MRSADECSARAEVCTYKARMIADQRGRDAWSKLASMWLDLAQQRERFTDGLIVKDWSAALSWFSAGRVDLGA